MNSINRIVRVSAAIIVENRKVLIAQRGPEDRLAGLWEFPGGKIEPDETPRACLARELLEELELKVAVGDFIGSHIHRYDHMVIELLAFKTRITGGKITLKEHSAYHWATVDHLDRFAFSPADIHFVGMIQRGEVV